VLKKYCVWILFIITILTAKTSFAVEKSLNSYHDYIIVLVHGINDFKNSFEGTNPEWDAVKNKARDWRHTVVMEKLGIPEGHVWAFSFSQNRGTNIRNAMELGYGGIKPEVLIDGKLNLGNFRGQVVNYNVWNVADPLAVGGEIGALAAGAFGNWPLAMVCVGVVGVELASGMNRPEVALDGGYITGAGYPRLMGDGKMASYVSALNEYYPTGVEWGKSFLEQAREDFKGWYLKSDKNKGADGFPIYSDVSQIPDADVPTKFILITHSMGNMAARLYIYSNELAAEGKYFKEGFYKGDVEKVVMVAAPLEGSDLGVVALASPIAKWAKAGMRGRAAVTGITRGLSVTGNYAEALGPAAEAVAKAQELWNMRGRLEGPIWQVNPLWWMVEPVEMAALIGEYKGAEGQKDFFVKYYGIAADARVWHQAAVELIPYELQANIRTMC
jgi:hypothetical protein